MKILDLTAGNRAVWFNKKHPDALYVDIRPEVGPDVVVDIRKDLREWVGIGYDLVVFDPPHMNCGPNSNFSKTYGYHTTPEILDLLLKASVEAYSVTRPGALMALKWNNHDISLRRVFGHGA